MRPAILRLVSRHDLNIIHCLQRQLLTAAEHTFFAAVVTGQGLFDIPT